MLVICVLAFNWHLFLATLATNVLIQGEPTKAEGVSFLPNYPTNKEPLLWRGSRGQSGGPWGGWGGCSGQLLYVVL